MSSLSATSMTDVDVLEDVETIGLNCFALGAENNETNA